ncbi:tetratricopeptide repeat protein [Desulfosediminicola flagellatus]|uniref:tetratricopeptide repeat protein n=1 Tax=Desulfosediminicola flagellatus TaxID=2569541 RepID=UPI0010ACE63A|nr:tetratricopeptide repeat protein [Desulfosediminicola flagellatus]
MKQPFSPLSKIFFLCAFATFLMPMLNGCVVKDIGNKVGHTIKGDYYLQNKDHREGRATFMQEVEENPTSPSARYYYGRFLLQGDENKAALTQFKKARELEPDNVDYQFWTGVAYGALNQKKSEEKSYRAALTINKKHLQSRIYLGHNLLEQKKYTDSLGQYEYALKIWPQSPSSLYNRALILKKLGRTPEEKSAWLNYLGLYPSGALARRATDHLNYMGDFSFRNHHIGARTVTIEKIWFEPITNRIADGSKESLKMIGAVIKNRKAGRLQIIAFQKNNAELARKKATTIKTFLLKEFPELNSQDIGISWFDKPQTIIVKKKKRHIDESVSFFIGSGKK